MNVEVNNESGVEIDAHGLMRLSRFVMSSLRLHPECELSIKLVDEDTMARYHVEFLDLPGPTDVMSWPMDELRPGTNESDDSDMPLGHLGDIALCPRHLGRARAADRARDPAPARVRPCGTRREGGDVGCPGAFAGSMASPGKQARTGVTFQ